MSLYDEAFPNGEFGFDPITISSHIADGESLINQSFNAGSFTGMAATASGLAAGLSPGEGKQLVMAALSAATDAAAGAEIGSCIYPVIGTAVGAAVGAIIGFVTSIIGSAPIPPPEGEFRCKAEQYAFPAVPNTPAQTGALEVLLAQNLAQPACWYNIRIHSAGYQVPLKGGLVDPATGMNVPNETTFGVGWVQPSDKSTPQSKAAAWYVAQAWAGQGAVTRSVLGSVYPREGTQPPLLVQAIRLARAQAAYALGGEAAMHDAIKLMNKWVGNGEEFSTAWTPESIPPVHGLELYRPGTDITAWQKQYARAMVQQARMFNKLCPLDYLYYISDTASAAPGATPTLGLLADPSFTAQWTPTPGRLIAMPDTSFVGVAEIACLVALGILPRKGAELIVMLFMQGLAWRWKVGQEEDMISGIITQRTIHPNFARIIGRLIPQVRVSVAEHRAEVASAGGTASINANRTQDFSAPATRQSGANRATMVSSSKTPAQSDNLVKWLGAATLAVGTALLVWRSSKKRED